MSDEDIVAALAEDLRQHLWLAEETPAGTRDEDFRPGAPCMDCGEYPGPRHERSDCVRAVARSMVGTVRRVAEQRAAEELESAATDLKSLGWHAVAIHLRDRAAALSPIAHDSDCPIPCPGHPRAAALTATPNHGTDVTT